MCIRDRFYVTLRNPDVPLRAVKSIRPAFRNELKLGEIRAELAALDGRTSREAAGGGLGLFGDLDAIDYGRAAE